MATKPPILRPGDTVGIVTLGSPLEADIINSRIRVLRDLGFNVVIGKSVYQSDGFLAGPAEQRAEDLMEMFRNPRVRMILPTRGGVGVAGILPYLDYNVIAANPKIISGYSDITVLLNVLWQKSQLVTFQSMMLLNFSYSTPPYNYDQFFAAVSTVASPRPITNPAGMPLISLVPGNVTGPLVGGNLTSFVDTLGTPYEVDTRGAILVLEETHEPINKVYRLLNHLILSGKLQDCAGIVMGQCTECQTAYGVSYDQLIQEVLVPLGKPLMTNLATAHGYYKAAIPIGVRANLDTVNNRLTLLEPAVSVL